MRYKYSQGEIRAVANYRHWCSD